VSIRTHTNKDLRASACLTFQRAFNPGVDRPSDMDCSAIYIRVILVIARKEKLLEELEPSRETTRRSAWYDSRKRHVVIFDSHETWGLGVDVNVKQCGEIKPTLSHNASLLLPKDTQAGSDV
jgi:hypothetical protein